jgi:hypothetical protein
MPRKRFDRLRRVREVESEFEAVRFCVDRTLNDFAQDSATKDADRVGSIQSAANRLEATYLIRIFAEFESAVRDFRATARATPPPVRTRDLLEGIGSRRNAARREIDAAHRVREYRNGLLHGRVEETSRVTVAEARQALCRFLSRLPLDW